MSIYGISDLHLALSIDKPMDVFGDRWVGYMEKLATAWSKTVSDGDFVVIPGDISWATYLEQAFEDFSFIDSLPGEKIILKGNHDYWWTTFNKLDQFLVKNNFSSIKFLNNNHYCVEETVICGTRGWKCPDDDDFNAEDRKIYNRELQRLELSLKSIKDINEKHIIVAMHYPPLNFKKRTSDFIGIMKGFNVKTCIYGHLHGEGFKNAFQGEIEGIDFKFISADYLNFTPLKLY